MQVYVELALAENFCMDFTLLYCAKLVSKNPARIARVAAASALGACFAVVFPLFGLKGAWALAVKIITCPIIGLASGKFKGFKAYSKMTVAFLAFTFAVGGGLIAVFSLAGLDYKQGEGYLLSSVPVGIPLFAALIAVIFARKLADRLKKTKKQTVTCGIYYGGKRLEIQGFFDSGNKVSFHGVPVSVIPLSCALKIIDPTCIKEQVKIHTVAGSKNLKVFTAEKIEISDGEKTDTVENVMIGISPYASGGAVLNPELLED